MKIVLENLTKVFKNRSKGKPDVIAINNFNLEIKDGTLVGLLGPSGCGKSTCLNLISGLEEATEGKIYFGDVDVTSVPPEKRGIGLVFQNYALYPHLTAKQNIMFPLENLKGDQKMSKEDMEKKAYEVAKLVHIEEYMDRKSSELSGGQQQRVAIARALVKVPNVLLLDEPLSNLDARLRLQIREEIRRIQNETNITTIFVTHDQEEAMSLSDYIIVMKNGIVQQIDAPQNVYDNPTNLFVAKFLGTPAINVFEAYIKDEKVYVDDEFVKDAKGLKDQEVYLAVRPEGFIPNKSGAFTLEVKRFEVMGRDISVVLDHKKTTEPTIRAIISSNDEVSRDSKELKFDLRDNKSFVFSKETEERLA